ncbi:MAG: hypothetical protein WBC73_07850 [Phormidesmis sp.]
MAKVLSGIGKLPDPAFYNDKILTLSDVQLRFAMADVVRRRWYPKMKIAINGREPSAATRNLVKAEGLILSKLLSIVSEVFLFNSGGYSHPAYWWFECCLEPSAHRSLMHEDYTPTKTKAGLRAAFESATAALRRRENPFKGQASFTLFDEAIKLADASTARAEDRENDLFYPSKFLPYVEARAKLSKLIVLNM